MRNRYKVMPLDSPFNMEPEGWEFFEVESCLKDYEEITPIFQRNGWYYDRKEDFAWIEVNGRAWRDKRTDDFLYRLSIQNHRPLADVERQAIEALMRRNMCPKALRKLYRLDENVRHLRSIRLDTTSYRFHKELRKKKENTDDHSARPLRRRARR